MPSLSKQGTSDSADSADKKTPIRTSPTIIPKSNQAFPHAPWQFAWKSPQWHSLPLEEEKDQKLSAKEKKTLDHTAARIQIPRDIPLDHDTNELLKPQQSTAATSSAAAATTTAQKDEQEEEEYVLTVTLVAGHQGLGTDIQLEVWRQPQPTPEAAAGVVHEDATKHDDPDKGVTTASASATLLAPSATVSLVASRSLQWPATSMMEFATTQNEESSAKMNKGNAAASQKKSKHNNNNRSRNNSSSLVALSLARKPPPDALSEWTNALDVLHWLSMDRTTGLTSVQRQWLTHLQRDQDQQQQQQQEPSSLENQPEQDAASTSKNENENNDDTGELLLFCLDTNHVLHAYKMQDLWQTHPSSPSDDGGMAALMLGLDLLAKVQSSILPLTQPWQQVRLSSWAAAESSSTAVAIDPLFQITRDGSTAFAFGQNIKTHEPHYMVPVADVLCIAGSGQIKKAAQRHHSKTSGSTATSAETQKERAGFCTFVSLRTLEEVRTVYLPFVPVHLSPWQWHGWIFLSCVGEQGQACAIRVDAATETTVPTGEAPSLFHRQSSTPLNSAQTVAPPPVRPLLNVARFQLVPVMWPTTAGRNSNRELQMVVGSAGIHSVAVYKNNNDDTMEVVQYAFGCLDALPEDRKELTETYGRYRPPNMGTSGLPVLATRTETVVATLTSTTVGTKKESCWCYTRHGWGLFGLGRELFWIGWQGQRQAVAYCKHLATLPEDDMMPLVEEIQPLHHFRELPATPQSPSKRVSTPKQSLSLQSSVKEVSDSSAEGPNVDELILDAMESISALNYRGPASPPTSPLRRFRKALTQREKSQRLLKQCSNWTKLHPENRITILEKIQPVVSLRGKSSQYLLTVRQADINHGEEAPFEVVLSWLAYHEDYFTASSLALDLLQDATSLRHLWESFGKIDPDGHNSYAVLEGLLDGVSPVIVDDKKRKNVTATENTLIQLADMTLGCLAKGGYRMSSTLEHFSLRDKHYSASRAALMLVATAAHTLSDDPDLVALAMGKGYTKTSHEDIDHEATLWPVRSLLNVGVARDMLGVVLLLLNATIPNILRNLKESDLVSAAEPSLSLCKALVSLIVGASPEGAELLLGLIDEQSRVLYWDSLRHETQLELSLVRIMEDCCPMLWQSTVRNWVLERLQDCLATEGSATAVNVFERTPSRWLQELVMATLRNARCALKEIRPAGMPSKHIQSSNSFDSYCHAVESARGVILSSKGKFDVDFDLLIGALLVLERRHLAWWEGARLTTQALLNAACHFAGRRSTRETLAPLDAPTLMRQCFLAGNVEAGANLIGGFNGLVLKCCHVLFVAKGLEIDDAEKFLLAGDFPDAPESESSTTFVATDMHYRILWLLREHVLKTHQYGEFVSSSARGHIDPIAAARVCLRAWWRITPASTEAISWLVYWLQQELEIVDNRSRHRLACAALLRALIWPSRTSELSTHQDPSILLASYLNLPNFFISQLALSACGLVEAVPKEYIAPSRTAPVSANKSSIRLPTEERSSIGSRTSEVSRLSSSSLSVE